MLYRTSPVELEYEIFKKLSYEGFVVFNDHIKQQYYLKVLRDKGLRIKIIDNRIILLDTIKILEHNYLEKFIDTNEQIVILYTTQSTNEYLKNNIQYSYVIAEHQNEGKGRRGKKWISPLGSNIYLSAKIQIDSTKNYSFFPLYISILLVEFLSKYTNRRLSIKWPNDIYIDNNKNSGSLLEQLKIHNEKYLIVGIGINVNMNSDFNNLIDQPYTSLNSNNPNEKIDRNKLLSGLLPLISNMEKNYNNRNFLNYIDRYNRFNYLLNKTINIIESKKSYVAKYIDLNKDGSIRIKYNGIYKDIYSADVSVRV